MLLVTKQIFLSNKEVRLYRNPFCKVVRHLEQVQSVIGKKTTTSIQSDLPLRITLQPLTGVSQLQAEAICWTDSKTFFLAVLVGMNDLHTKSCKHRNTWPRDHKFPFK